MRKYAPYCAGTNPALSKRSPVTYWGEFRNGCRTACRRTAESPVATSSYPLASLDLTRDVAITPSHPGTHDHAAARRALARRRPCQPPTKAQVPAAAELDERPPRRVRQAPADQQAPDAIRAA